MYNKLICFTKKRVLFLILIVSFTLAACSSPMAEMPEPVQNTETAPREPTISPTITPTKEAISLLAKFDTVIDYYADYIPDMLTNKDAIYQEIDTARALLAGREIDRSSWTQDKYENVHMAIWLIQEEQRGMQPLQFDSNGETYYYDKDKSIDNPWSSDPEKKEQSTIPIYMPMYRDAENLIHFYWNGEWQIAPRSDEVDYGNFITKDNVNDFLDPEKTNDILLRQLEMFDVSFVPMIILDDTTADLEKHPMYRQGMTYLDVRIDVLLPNADNYLYGLNGKMYSMDSQFIMFPNTDRMWGFKNELGTMNQYFDEAFNPNQTVYVGLDEHQVGLDKSVNTREYVENMSITDDIVDGSIWQDIQNSAGLNIFMWNAMSFTRVRSDGQWVEIP